MLGVALFESFLQMKKTLTIAQYPGLISQISALLQQARTQVVQQVNTTMIETYRYIGKYVVEYEQGGADRATYGTRLLEHLSEDLTKQFGKGFSRQTLQNMKQFYITYPICQTVCSKSLSWSHYLFLMRLEPDERSFYEIEASQNHWSLRELQRQFDSGLYLRLSLSKDKKEIKALSTKGQCITSSQDIVKDPYILEFL
jgi:formyltetrahydrofolate hydrolase